MCLNTRVKEPRIAKRDITVRKYLKKSENTYTTPYQGVEIKLGETMIPAYPIPDINPRGNDDFNNTIYSLNGGVIHAKTLRSNDCGNCCKQAIIPKGAKYWLNTPGTEIASDKLIITDKDGENCNLRALWEEILEEAPDAGQGFKVGDIILEDGTAVSPLKYKGKGIAIVCGSHNGKPLACALESIESSWGNTGDIVSEVLSSDEAIKAFNGIDITRKYKKSKTNLRAFETCINYRKGKNNNEEWYFGALGEMTTMLDNSLYLNAAFDIIGLGLNLEDYWFWSCSEGGASDDAWGCYLDSGFVGCYWDNKYGTCSIVPFLAYNSDTEGKFIKKNK